MMQAMRAQAQAQATASQGGGGGGLMGGLGGLGGGESGSGGKVGETEEERRERKNKKRKVEASSSTAGASAALPASTPLPPSPATANHRPRNKIQYIPLQRDSTTYGGWDVDGIEQDRLRTKASRKPRPVNELGAVDIEGLLMSLQSRIQSEVSYALTTIEMLSVQPSGLGRDSGAYEGVLPLKNCPDLLEELVELLEEVSIGEGGMARREQVWKGGKAGGKEKEKKRLRTTSSQEEEEHEMVVDAPVVITSSSSKLEPLEDTRKSTSKPRLVHSALVLLGHEGTERLRSERKEEGGVRSTRSAEIILVIVNIIRNLSFQNENVTILGRYTPLLHILTAICEPSMAGLTVSLEPLPPTTSSPTSSSAPPPPFSIIDLANVRKDVLYILSNLAHDIPFSSPTFPLPVVQSIFDIVTSFIFEADGDLYPSSMSTTDPIAASRILAAVPVYLELGIAAFSRLTVQDENRLVFGRLPPQDLWDLYTTLVRFLPVTEADFFRSSQEVWTGFNERVCLSIYNLVFLAPSSVKTQIRRKTGYTTILVRILKKLYPNTTLFKENSYAILCRRILETFGVLNEGGEGDGAGVWLDFGTGQGKETEVKKKPRVEMPGWLTGTPGLFEDFFKIKETDGVTFEELDGLMSDL
ncbi:hypothetical protein BDY24DRAFT_389533 [Mrakia frigida]|uniref:uncharacterized protein n=1 Tax=Mrakia frigida TaxID=29902 RepID=UPI003FCC0056